MKCRVNNKNTMTCPKCKHKMKRNGRNFQCKSCGYFKAEEQSNHEKRIMNMGYDEMSMYLSR